MHYTETLSLRPGFLRRWSYQFSRNTEFSYGPVRFYSGYATIGGNEVNEDIVQLIAIFQQFFHRFLQRDSLFE